MDSSISRHIASDHPRVLVVDGSKVVRQLDRARAACRAARRRGDRLRQRRRGVTAALERGAVRLHHDRAAAAGHGRAGAGALRARVTRRRPMCRSWWFRATSTIACIAARWARTSPTISTSRWASGAWPNSFAATCSRRDSRGRGAVCRGQPRGGAGHPAHARENRADRAARGQCGRCAGRCSRPTRAAGGVGADVVLTDVSLKGELTGGDLLERIRNEFGYGKGRLPVLVMTGDDNPANQAALIRAGANDLVEKPVEEKLLITKLLFQLRVGRHLRERAGTLSDARLRLDGPAGKRASAITSQRPEMQALATFLRAEKRAGKRIYPPGPEIFAAFDAHAVRCGAGGDPRPGSLSRPRAGAWPVLSRCGPACGCRRRWKTSSRKSSAISASRGPTTAALRRGPIAACCCSTRADGGRRPCRRTSGQGLGRFHRCRDRRTQPEREGLVFLLWGSARPAQGAADRPRRHLRVDRPASLAAVGPPRLHRLRAFLRRNRYLEHAAAAPIDWSLPPVPHSRAAHARLNAVGDPLIETSGPVDKSRKYLYDMVYWSRAYPVRTNRSLSTPTAEC